MAREEQKIRSEQVRKAILDIAMEMGIREGFDSVSIRKIIHQMNYSTGVVYHHFKDRQEIIDAIEEEETGRLNRIIESIQDANKDVLSNMEATFHRVMLLAFEEPEKYNLIVLHKYSRRSPERPRWLQYLSEHLKKGMEDGIVREMDPEKAAFTIWSSFLGFNLMISRLRNLKLDEVETLFSAQYDMILRGIARPDH
jgi:AcrR family transcriptional regulator